jgi:hypothetical protein
LHRHGRTPHHHPHNLTKLIARDKAVSTFRNCTRKPSKREVLDMQFGCSKEKLYSSLLYTTIFFSCRYSMSHDISISLLKTILKIDFLVNSLGKGDLI